MAYASLKDIRLHYLDEGSGEVVLLLHGLGSGVKDWEYQRKQLSQHYRVISLDLRGHGESEKPDSPYSIELFAEDVASFLRKIDISTAHVVGYSLGGMVAFQLISQYPDKVLSLTIINSTPEVSFSPIVLYWRLLLVQVLGLRVLGKSIAKKMYPKTEQSLLRDKLLERMQENEKSSYIRALKSISNWGVVKDLGGISCDVLVIAAEDDYSPVGYKQYYCGLIKSATLEVVTDSGHGTPMDQPEKLDKLLQDFLGKQKK